MVRPTEPVFLARETYRRRRVIDAAKLLPILGLTAFLLPLLGQGLRRTAASGLYIFAIWLGLILAAALITRALSRGPDGVGADPLEPAPGPAAAPPPPRAEDGPGG